MEVDRGAHANDQGNGCGDDAKLLGLPVGLLVGEHQDDDRHEGDGGQDGAELRLEEELHLVGLGGRVDVVGLLPELACNDHADEVEHDKRDEPDERLARKPGERPIEDQQRQHLEDDCANPQADGDGTALARVAGCGDLVHANLARDIVGIGHDGSGGYLLASLGVDEPTIDGTLALPRAFFCHDLSSCLSLVGADGREDLGFGLGCKV